MTKGDYCQYLFSILFSYARQPENNCAIVHYCIDEIALPCDAFRVIAV